jgi:hypothetical protein
MRLLFLFISNIASFISAFGISLFTDLVCTDSETSNYFLLLSFASPLASIKTNTQYISTLKSFSGSFRLLQKLEIFIVLAIFIYFTIRSRSNISYAIAMSSTCYLFSMSLSIVMTKLSLLSSLRDDLRGPAMTIKANVLRLLTFAIALLLIPQFETSNENEIGRPIMSIVIASVSLLVFFFVFLKKEILPSNLNKTNITISNENQILLIQLVISVSMASWTSLDRWILGLSNVSPEILTSTSWNQTAAIAFSSICFSSLYKYTKPKRHVKVGKYKLSSPSFFYLAFFGILIVTLLLLNALLLIPLFNRLFMVDGNNILGVVLVGIFFQRAGIYIVYQEKSIKINILQASLMILFVIASIISFLFLVLDNILYAEMSITILSILWFLGLVSMKYMRKQNA